MKLSPLILVAHLSFHSFIVTTLVDRLTEMSSFSIIYIKLNLKI